MTEGNIPRQLVSYAVPLILGNLFQLTYNAVDSMIVGQLIGKEALAAVGTASPVMNLMILGISGLCIGSSVLMSHFYGGGKQELLKRELSTTMVFGLYFSLLVMTLGILAADPLLRMLQVPPELLGTAKTYLRIVFAGLPFTFFYNAVSSALKSIGDSKTPLKFLAFCSVLNGLLDLIFISLFHFGIVCCALTTVVAEALSAILCIRYVYQKIPLLQIRRHEFRADRGLLKQTLQYGGVTALQQACQPIGKLMIQGTVNSLGVDVMAAFNAINRLDDYACLPEQSIASGITTFVAQNEGAGKRERMEQGFRLGLLLEAGYWVVICSILLCLRKPIMSLFVSSQEGAVVELGIIYFGIMSFFYLFPAMTNGMQGYFRGRKNMKMTLLGTLIQTGIRVALVYVLVPRIGLNGVAYASAGGWSLMLLVEIPYYLYCRRKERTSPEHV